MPWVTSVYGGPGAGAGGVRPKWPLAQRPTLVPPNPLRRSHPEFLPGVRVAIPLPNVRG